MINRTPAPEAEIPVHDFVAELVPHRSLGRKGFIMLMAFVAATSLLSGILFLAAGAWPVLVFFGMDVFVVWLAFHLNYRSARVRERILVGREELKVEKFDTSGRMSEFRFNPFWTRFEVSRHDEIGITSMKLRSREVDLPVGAFLNPQDRETFARAFGAALVRAKA